MDFYTHFFLNNNDLCVNAIENGKRVKKKYKLRPSLYITSEVGTHKNLSGNNIGEMKFDSVYEAKNFIKENRGGSSNLIFGFPRFEYTKISELYSPDTIDTGYDSAFINVVYIDIETTCEDGFPDINLANETVNAITIGKDGILYTLGLQELDHKIDNYVYCESETVLLEKFLELWKHFDPDIVSGWFIEFFDIPYLVNRIDKILGRSKELSPWGILKRREVKNKFGNDDDVTYELKGISILDYIALYKKFTYTMQESYKLDHIAYVELGERKLDYSEYGNKLHLLYQEDYTKFIEYNRKDVELVVNLENKMKLIELVLGTAYSAKANYNDVFMNVRIWDVIIANYLRITSGIHVPTIPNNKDDLGYEGAFVKHPIPGMYEWVTSFDLTSLYPSLIMQYNISPETYHTDSEGFDLSADDVIGANENYEAAIEYANERNLTLTGNGSMYTKEFRGFLPILMERFFNKRQEAKEHMLDADKMIQKLDKYLIENT